MGLFEFSIDIETATVPVTKFGSGPITSATNWTHTPRLDGAGEFRFTMPASDEKSRNLANKRIARCYAILNGARTELGAGIIDKIQTSVSDPTMLEVSGPDIMGELAYRTVGNLIVCEQAWTDLSDSDYGLLAWVRTDITGAPDPTIAIANAHDGNDGTYESIYLMSEKDGYPEHAAWLYVGHDARYDQIRVLFAGSDFANNAQTLAAQYYNGSGWVALSVTDGTANTGTFQKNGDITFTRPTDWARYYAVEAGGDWFWVRMRVARTAPDDPSWTDYFKLAEVDVYADVPTKGGIDLIMAYAPSTWVRTGYADTVSDKYLEFQGESVLEALLTLAEQGGIDGTTAIREHFRYDPASPREVDWLGTTITSSGVRAISPEYALAAEGKAELAIIQTLTEIIDTTETVTRVYPHSLDGLTLALSTRDAPTGYAHDLTNNYIQHTAGNGAYGQIDRWIDFTDVSMQQADSYTTHPAMVANQLHDRAVEWLRTHATASSFYQLSLVQWYGLIMAGDTIDVVYHEYTDALHTVDIDTISDGTALHVIAPTIMVDAQGVGIIGLEVATIDREAKTDAGVVVDLVRENKRYGAGAGNYATIAVTGGGQPPTAGPDIRVSGYQVSRAGAGVLLFDSGGALLAEYAADATGLAAALAAATSGDIVEMPAGTITLTATLAVAAGITLRGRSWASIVGGYITLGVGSTAQNFKVYQSVSTANDIVGISGPGAAGECYVRDVFVELIQAGAGKALGLLGTGTGKLIWSGSTRVRVNGGTGSRWAAAAADSSTIEGNHGNVKAWIGA